MSKKKNLKHSEYPSVANFILKGKNSFSKKKIENHLKNVVFDTTTTTATAPAPAPATATADENSEFVALKSKFNLCEQNLKIAKDLLRHSSQINHQKDLKIEQLMRENAKSNLYSDHILFEGYSSHFDTQELIEIRSVGPGFKKDSTFITKIMKSLYKNDLKKLEKQTATGKKYKKEKKTKLLSKKNK